MALYRKPITVCSICVRFQYNTRIFQCLRHHPTFSLDRLSAQPGRPLGSAHEYVPLLAVIVVIHTKNAPAVVMTFAMIVRHPFQLTNTNFTSLQPTVAVWLNAEVILLFLQQSPEVASLAAIYLKWSLLGLPAYVITY